MKREKYFVFEGFDGSGKSTLIRALVGFLNQQGLQDIAVVNYVTPAPSWMSHSDLEGIIVGDIPSNVEADMRIYRYQMQYRYYIKPLLAAGISVFGDRGPASAIWRTRFNPEIAIDTKIYKLLASVDHHFILTCSGLTAYERITAKRPLNRVEAGYSFSNNPAVHKSMFLMDHSNYYKAITDLLAPYSHSLINSEQPIENMLEDILLIMSQIMETPLEHSKGSDVVLSTISSKTSDKSPLLQRQHYAISLASRYFDDIKFAQISLEAIEQTITQLAKKPDAKLEAYIYGLVSSGRTDIENLLIDLLDKVPIMIRPISRGISKNPTLLSPRLIKDFLLDDKARSYFVCQFGKGAVHLPLLKHIVKLLEEEVDRNYAIQLALYVKAAEKDTREVLKNGSLLFADDIQVCQAAIHSWISCEVGSYLPASFSNHKSQTVRFLMSLHDVDTSFPIIATNHDEVFYISENSSSIRVEQEILHESPEYLYSHFDHYIKPSLSGLSEDIILLSRIGNSWQQESIDLKSIAGLEGLKLFSDYQLFVRHCQVN